MSEVYASFSGCKVCRGRGHLDGTQCPECLAEVAHMRTALVDKPVHYNMGNIEVIDFIEDQRLGFHEGNVVKYVSRAKHKGNEIEDLRKAQWYLKRRIAALAIIALLIACAAPPTTTLAEQCGDRTIKAATIKGHPPMRTCFGDGVHAVEGRACAEMVRRWRAVGRHAVTDYCKGSSVAVRRW